MISQGHARPHYVSDEVLDARYFRALDRFDIRFAPTMWVFDNVRTGSRVLHVGCGAGMLALLKRKRVILAGVDALKEAAQTARRNGYDATYEADLSSLPFAAGSFDYVVSFELLSAMTAEEAAAILAEMKRVLRPDGVSMHTVACDTAVTDADHVSRFLEVFAHVAVDSRYALCLSVEGFLERAEHESAEIEKDFVDFLRGLSFKERRAFDLAMGYVFSRVSDAPAAALPDSWQVLVKASNAPLGPFYNEHRDRRSLFAARDWHGENGLCLDRSTAAVFDEGWFAPEILPPVARCMGQQARVRFHADEVSEIELDVRRQLPQDHPHPAVVEIALNDVRLCAFSLYRDGWMHLRMPVPDALRSVANHEYEIEFRADQTAQRADDDREVSIAVCNIEVKS